MRLMRGEKDVGVIGIRGGGWIHVKERLKFCRPGSLATVRSIAILIGGNDLARRNSRPAEGEATKATEREQTSLLKFVALLMPKAQITTYDLVPRESRNGVFNCRARALAKNLPKATENHRHINYIKSFTTLSIRKHNRDKAEEKYPCVAVFYRGGDGTHLNVVGYQALRRIVDWGLVLGRGSDEVYEFEMAGWKVRANVKF